MKAKPVGPAADAPFGQALAEILDVRLREVDSFAAAAARPAQLEALHDMRIAVKRVRYLLELAGPEGEAGIKAAKKVQDLLGEIHDCDELVPLVERHVARLRAEDVDAARQGKSLPNRRKYRGLEALRALASARRGGLHEQFVEEWPRRRRSLGLSRKVTA